MDEDDPDALPGGYWWSERPDQALLHLRYGWAATVTPTSVRVGSSGPYHPEIRGPCHSVAHGKRIVERILAVRLCLGTPERAEYRRRLLDARVNKVLGPPGTARPDGVDDLLY